MFLTETHLHTSESSACGRATGAEQAEQYKALGYDTIFVTDHFMNGNSAVDRSLPWKEQVEAYCLGFENAKKRGDEIGLTVLFGIEYGWAASDFLVYGVDKEWLLGYPDTLRIDVREFCDRVHAAGGCIVQAHPFREADYISDIKLLPWHTDGVEVFNSGNRQDVFNDRARWYAEQYGKPMTAGSDCHAVDPNGRFAGVYTERKIETAADYVEAVNTGLIKGLKIPE